MIRTAIGVALVVAHAAAFVALARTCGGSDLAVELTAPATAAAPQIAGRVPAALADRVATALDPATGPGLVRRTWSVTYRGGFERRVGAAQLVGPFQDPAAPTCTGRVVVGQRLLDDGRAGPGTVAHAMTTLFDRELRGESFFGAGDYRRVRGVSLRWAELARHPADRALVRTAPHGYVRVTATLAFDRVDVPLTVALIPRLANGALEFRIAARAGLDFDNRALQWLSNTVGADRMVTRLAREQLDGALITALAPPPPFALPDGQLLTFGYCGAPPEITDGVAGAIPFSLAIAPAAHAPGVLPPRHGPAARAPIAADTRLALDLDLDALNALLYELWRSGFLDRRLAAAGLDRRFNAEPLVQQLLAIRISPLTLALPPVLAATAAGLHLAAEARLAIADGGGAPVTGRLWGGLDFAFAGTAVAPVAVAFGALELSCERTPATLVPCYADLVAALRDRGREVHGELTRVFAALMADIFVDRRLAADGIPVELVIRGVAPRVVAPAPPNASVRLELDAALAPLPR